MDRKRWSWPVQSGLFAFYGDCGPVQVLVHVPKGQKTGPDWTYEHYMNHITKGVPAWEFRTGAQLVSPAAGC